MIGFLFPDSLVTAYLMPDGVVIISLAVAANDGWGCDTSPASDVPPTTVAIDVDKNSRRPSTVESLTTEVFPPLGRENAAVPELQRRMTAAIKARDFTMIQNVERSAVL